MFGSFHTAAKDNAMGESVFDSDSGRQQLKKPSAVNVPVNGQRMQMLRQLAGMTQEELAQKAGYSDRLVRKAEASSPLRKSTVADLADALSTESQRVTVADLVFSRELIAVDIADFLLNGNSTLSGTWSDLLHPKFSLHAAGEELNIPFAGHHAGAGAFEAFRNQLNTTITVVEFLPDATCCFVANHETCVHASTLMKPLNPVRSFDSPLKIWWFLRKRFESTRLISMEVLYDTGSICRLLGRL